MPVFESTEADGFVLLDASKSHQLDRWATMCEQQSRIELTHRFIDTEKGTKKPHIVAQVHVRQKLNLENPMK